MNLKKNIKKNSSRTLLVVIELSQIEFSVLQLSVTTQLQ